ncbi:hypothetical protein [Streptomyces rimosus]
MVVLRRGGFGLALKPGVKAFEGFAAFGEDAQMNQRRAQSDGGRPVGLRVEDFMGDRGAVGCQVAQERGTAVGLVEPGQDGPGAGYMRQRLGKRGELGWSRAVRAGELGGQADAEYAAGATAVPFGLLA